MRFACVRGVELERLEWARDDELPTDERPTLALPLVVRCADFDTADPVFCSPCPRESAFPARLRVFRPWFTFAPARGDT